MERHVFSIRGFEVLEKVARAGSSDSARLYVPKSWDGKKVAMVRME